MTTTKKDALAKRDELIAAYEALRDASRVNKTPETMTAAIDAGRILSEFIVANDLLPKAVGFGSRAGMRQATERNAQYGWKPKKNGGWTK